MEESKFFAGADKERVLVNYIRNTADRMGLKDWQFFLKPESCDEKGYLAYTHVWGDSKTADISVSESFFRMGPQMQRESIVHELVHWHHDPLGRYVRTSFRNTVGGLAAEQFGHAFEQHEERFVDAVAAAWARNFPLIDWDDTSPIFTEYERKGGEWNEHVADKGATSLTS
jgi:hypothetical protein